MTPWVHQVSPNSIELFRWKSSTKKCTRTAIFYCLHFAISPGSTIHSKFETWTPLSLSSWWRSNSNPPAKCYVMQYIIQHNICYVHMVLHTWCERSSSLGQSYYLSCCLCVWQHRVENSAGICLCTDRPPPPQCWRDSPPSCAWPSRHMSEVKCSLALSVLSDRNSAIIANGAS